MITRLSPLANFKNLIKRTEITLVPSFLTLGVPPNLINQLITVVIFTVAIIDLGGLKAGEKIFGGSKFKA